MYEFLYRDPPPEYLPELGKYAWDAREYSSLLGAPQQDGLIYATGLHKKIAFAEFDPGGAPNLVAIDPWSKDKGLTKVASGLPLEFRQMVDSLEPMSDRIYVMGNALGAYESYGGNKNADAFLRMGLMNSDPDTYGYKTFEKFGHIYTHHQNKDPAKAIGGIKYAFWDEGMDKVLLIFWLLKSLAPHLVQRLEDGGTFPTSMGCRCPYDVCSICFQKAPTRLQYCDHLKYYPNQVLPDGRQVVALTPHPRFFDYSAVIKGADRISHALQILDPGGAAKEAYERRPHHFPMYSRTSMFVKTAAPVSRRNDGIPMGNDEAPRRSDEEIDVHLCRSIEEHDGGIHPEDLSRWRQERHKTSAQKRSTITKRIDGMAEKLPVPTPPKEDPRVVEFAKQSLPVLEASEPTIPGEQLIRLARDYSLPQIISTFTKAGIVLKPEEFELVVLATNDPSTAFQETGNSGEIPMDPLPPQRGREPLPPQAEAYKVKVEEKLKPRTSYVQPGLLQKLTHLMPERSVYAPFLYQRALRVLAPMAKVANAGLPAGTQIVIIPPQDSGGSSMLDALKRLLGFSPSDADLRQLAEKQRALRAQAAASHSGGPSMNRPPIPPNVMDLLLRKLLYTSYRNNLGGGDAADVMDSPITAPDVLAPMKAASDAIFGARGIPSYTYLKCAYLAPWGYELPTWISTVACDGPVVPSFIAAPLRSHEKVSEVLDLGVGYLVDAATMLSLRFAGGALRESLERAHPGTGV